MPTNWTRKKWVNSWKHTDHQDWTVKKQRLWAARLWLRILNHSLNSPQTSWVRHLLWWIHQAFQELMPILLKLFQNKTKIKQTNRRGTNTPPLVPWGRDSSDTKTRQGRQRTRESRANIPGNRHRNPQNVSKPSSTIHDKGHTPWSNGVRSGDARLFDTRQRGSVIQRVEGMKH